MSEPTARRVQFMMVGGFLGAGKTTALGRLARALADSGRRVAILTNDQAEGLVDTALSARLGLPVAEIAGGCFCCRFQDLIDRADELLAAIAPDALLAEPVGSCADLTATVLQPLKRYYGQKFVVSPYSVLVDPERIDELMQGPRAASPLGYLFRKQLEEADLLVLNKQDTLPQKRRDELLEILAAEFPATPALPLSALSGDGLEAWWRAVEAGPSAGQRLLDIDYDTYAAAEASLGWLNLKARLAGPEPFDAAAVAHALLSEIRHGAVRLAAEIGHVKVLVEAENAALRMSLTRIGAPIEPSGGVPSPVEAATLTLNARVEMPPEELRDLVMRGLRRICNEQRVTPEIETLSAFSPARPEPTYRFDTPL
ncbi:MAG: cobalamin biosynthesis protein P47K [Armatimonadetes bacterium]|nr:cobalamin biosynthesis protein P47K [Armatimonadota bacterium]